MDLDKFMQALAQATAWVIAHGQILTLVLVALIVALFLFRGTRSD